MLEIRLQEIVTILRSRQYPSEVIEAGVFSAVLHRIRFILAGNDYILHESLDDFEIRPVPNTGLHGNR